MEEHKNRRNIQNMQGTKKHESVGPRIVLAFYWLFPIFFLFCFVLLLLLLLLLQL